METTVRNEVRLMMDSGAFSAWTHQESIDIHQYIDFVLRHRSAMKVIINLDVIPGAWGITPSPAQVEESALRGYKNAMLMRKAGIECLPVYHMKERRYWLDRYIGEGFKYVGLGVITSLRANVKMKYLDEVFEYLCGDRGFPEVKVHGFALTALPIIYRYPWASVDSTTWQLMPGYGWILVPYRKQGAWGDRGGEYDYSRAPFQIGVTDDANGRNPDSQTLRYHIRNIGPGERAYVESYLKSEGVEVKDIANNSEARIRLAAKFFRSVAAAWTPQPFKNHKPNFGLHPTDHRPGSDTPPANRLRFYFATHPGSAANAMLTEEGCRDRLISYYPLIGKPHYPLASYALTGQPVRLRKVKKSQVS